MADDTADETQSHRTQTADRLPGVAWVAVAKYGSYRVLKSAGFAAPFYVLFMVGNGVTYTDLGLGTSVMAVVSIATELPSGFLGDRLGRRRAILVGQVFGALGTTGYLLARSTAGVVAMFVAFGLSAAIQSGSDGAWFYDILVEHGVEERYTEIASRLGLAVNVVQAGTMVAGAALYLQRPGYAIGAAVAAAWLCVAVVATFPANGDGDATDQDAPVPSDALGVREAAGHVRRFLSNPAVRTIVLVSSLYYGAMYANSKYIQPTTLAVLPGDGVAVGDVALPPAVVLAFLYAVFASGGGVLTRFGEAADARLGVAGTCAFSFGTGALCMVVPLLWPLLALPAMAGFMILPSLAGPALGAYFNERTTSEARATTLSARSLVMALVRIPILLAGGILADLVSPTVAMAALGTAVLVAGTSVTLVDWPLASAAPGAASD